MKRIKIYINWFLLILSVSFVFPVKYWHECVPEKEEQTQSIDLGDLDYSEADDHCDLCDLVFTSFVPDNSKIEITAPESAIFKQIISFDSPFQTPISYFLLRGPPIA